MRFKVTRTVEVIKTIEIDIPLPDYLSKFGDGNLWPQAAVAYMKGADESGELDSLWDTAVSGTVVTYEARALPDYVINENEFLKVGGPTLDPHNAGFVVTPVAKPEEDEKPPHIAHALMYDADQ
jgi:hypothetical protein